MNPQKRVCLHDRNAKITFPNSVGAECNTRNGFGLFPDQIPNRTFILTSRLQDEVLLVGWASSDRNNRRGLLNVGFQFGCVLPPASA